jgi:hypothetical protein
MKAPALLAIILILLISSSMTNADQLYSYRTRYFTDSGVIGSKEFVSKTYMRFKHHFNSKNEKKPKPVKGLEGMYSLKRLSEVI